MSNIFHRTLTLLLHYLVKLTLVYERYNSVVLLSDQIFRQSITQLYKSDKWLTKSTQSVSSKAMFEVPSIRMHTHSKSSTPLLNSHINSQLFKAAPLLTNANDVILTSSSNTQEDSK